MAVKIRLKRVGMPKQPYYRIVAIDSRLARDGKELEILGQYNPRNKAKVFAINSERVKYWLSCGAQPSDTVQAFLIREGLISESKRKLAPAKAPKSQGEKPETKEAPAAAAPQQ